MKYQSLKKWAIILIFSCILCILPNSIMAKELTYTPNSVTISHEEATIMAINNNNDLKDMESQINSLISPYAGRSNIVNNSTQKYDMKNRMDDLYIKLLSGKAMSLNEHGELMMIYTIYKNSDKVKGIDISQYISNKDFPDASVCANIVKLKINKELSRISIEDNIYQLYNNIIIQEKSLSISEENYNLQKDKYNNILKNFNNGKISENDKYISGAQLNAQLLELNKEKRLLQNSKYNINRLIGIPLKCKIILKPINKKLNENIKSYESYLSEAQLNRYEIVSIKADLKAKEIELYLFKNIYRQEFESDDLNLYKRDLEIKIKELTLNIKETEQEIKRQINEAYGDILNKKESMLLAKKNIEIETKKFKKTALDYKAGTIGKIEFTNKKLEFERATLEERKATMSYDYALYKMKNAVNIGPKYSSSSI